MIKMKSVAYRAVTMSAVFAEHVGPAIPPVNKIFVTDAAIIR